MAEPAVLSQSAQNKKWEREDDARTLARAEEIRTDSRRLKGAVIEAKAMAKKTEKEAMAMKRVASKNSPAKTPVKKTPVKKPPIKRNNKKK